MVDQYNQSVANQGLAPEEMKAVCVELKGEEGELDGAKFDVIVCASAYHHFSSIADVTRTLAYFLKPGGSLLVADLMKGVEGGEIVTPEVHHMVPHRGGFGEADIREVFDGAGLVNFTYGKAAEGTHLGRKIELFIAKGDKLV
ncbi:hypothetical protein SERLA73DRAFT_141641 [Serpula lacrymans var. lacrymans S7.3]|uniref:Methyltransferase type 11 domain-containing protein n=2 Tax=Serpula lacrymans var. lacrymans TaxID=341189 RepID=F8Q6R2_SERL3|nr:hypothetical protein SERLA73DRAFT_141641 [Serpula lacrymans var. lacrymans S7.3]